MTQILLAYSSLFSKFYAIKNRCITKFTISADQITFNSSLRSPMYTQYINEERMNLISFKRIMVYLQNPIISNYRYFKSMEYLSNDLYEINVSLSQSYSLHQKKRWEFKKSCLNLMSPSMKVYTFHFHLLQFNKFNKFNKWQIT